MNTNKYYSIQYCKVSLDSSFVSCTQRLEAKINQFQTYFAKIFVISFDIIQNTKREIKNGYVEKKLSEEIEFDSCSN